MARDNYSYKKYQRELKKKKKKEEKMQRKLDKKSAITEGDAVQVPADIIDATLGQTPHGNDNKV